jgi:hypothetical protein
VGILENKFEQACLVGFCFQAKLMQDGGATQPDIFGLCLTLENRD